MKMISASKKHHQLAVVGIFLLAAALVTGMAGCTGTPGVQIRDWYDLDAVRDNLDDSYILMNDLDSTTPGYEELAGPAANGGKGWQPIGIYDPPVDNPFTGTLDGQGYEIHDLFINRPDEFDVALFLEVDEGGRIGNIGVVNVIITGRAQVGSLVAINGGTVSKSYSTGSVTGNEMTGGLVGVNYEGTVSDSYFTGNVTGSVWVGGLVGENAAGTVSYSYSTGSVTSPEVVGGLVGDNALGTLLNCYSIASVTGEATVGGLVGYNEHGTVSYSYSTGNVTGNEVVAGLVGANHDSTVSYSYSTGNVTGDTGVGGLVGVNGGTVSSSYSSGNVVGEQDVGGLVGHNWTGGTVSNSFWDTETSGQLHSDGGTGKNTTEMKDIATFLGAGWDIIEVANPGTRNPSYIWNIVDAVTYPFLSWQPV